MQTDLSTHVAQTTSSQPRTIRQLSSDVVDQIAAGEVVERPAHLVKELVENALDAGAKSIEIEYDKGGRRVRVTDDGGGIVASELSLALSRHATSKLESADDLWHLHSFGFRGEALASVGSVSRLTLQSRTADDPTAHQVICEFGRLSAVRPCAGNPGTTILVEELFSNTPARLKFMKSESAESAQIKATLRALALANEGVEFRIRSAGRVEAIWPRATSFLERAQQVLGQEKLYTAELSFEGYFAEAVFAGPHTVGGNARGIQIFVQKRWVQDRGLQAAVIDAFRGLLMHGEFPIATVRLTAPSTDVDVNIHPSKSQVKFRDSSMAFRAVNRALRAAIEKAPWLERAPVAETPGHDELAFAPMRKLSVAELTRPYGAPPPDAPPDAPPAAQPDAEPAAPQAAPISASSEKAVAETLASAPVHSTGRFEAPEFHAVVFRQKEDQVAKDAPAKGRGPWSRLHVIGQAHLTYIVTQDDAKLVMVDQHAAHERVAYERLMRGWRHGQASVQTLLIPLAVELEPEHLEAVLGITADLAQLGIAIDQLSPTTLAIRAKPAMISDKALMAALKEFAREIAERGGSFVLEGKISDLCATMACHSVVRAGQALSPDQMRSLLEQMDEFPLSSFCPHGRPVSLEFPFTQIERDFGRIV